MSQTTASYGTPAADQDLGPLNVERRAPGVDDVAIQIEYCGVCHSDLHFARNDWGNSLYPAVPGHEIVGRITATGDAVDGFKEGDMVAVGCMVDSCRDCGHCDQGLQQYCEKGATMTYGSRDRRHDNSLTFGGYSQSIVVDQRYVLRLPEGLDPAGAAPLLCAGITTYSPLKQWNIGPGMTVGVIGLGGLGHMGVKFASAMGAKVVMITSSPEKGEDAKKLGADDVLISSDRDAMKAQREQFDFLLDTIPVGHSLHPYLGLLKLDGTIVIVGAIEPMEGFHSGFLLGRRRRISASAIGGIPETQEMLDFCGEHNITSEIEVIKMQDINHAYERMQRSDVKYRFVIDMASMNEPSA